MLVTSHTLDHLEQATGFSKRQIRFYITKRLVPGSRERGPNATYPPETLHRLHRIAQLKEQPVGPTGRQMTLEEIRYTLDQEERPDPRGMICASGDFGDDDPYGWKDRSSALDYLHSLEVPDEDDEPAPRASFAEQPTRELPFDEFASPATPSFLSRMAPPTEKGGEDETNLTSLLNHLQSALAELGSDTRFIAMATDGAQWLRIASPDVEFHIRQPDDHRARQRLSDLAHALGRLLAREE